jgi:hypothetical protein
MRTGSPAENQVDSVQDQLQLIGCQCANELR